MKKLILLGLFVVNLFAQEKFNQLENMLAMNKTEITQKMTTLKYNKYEIQKNFNDTTKHFYIYTIEKNTQREVRIFFTFNTNNQCVLINKVITLTGNMKKNRKTIEKIFTEIKKSLNNSPEWTKIENPLIVDTYTSNKNHSITCSIYYDAAPLGWFLNQEFKLILVTGNKN